MLGCSTVRRVLPLSNDNANAVSFGVGKQIRKERFSHDGELNFSKLLKGVPCCGGHALRMKTSKSCM